MPKLIWYISHLILDINLWFNIVKLCVSAYSGHLDTGVSHTHTEQGRRSLWYKKRKSALELGFFFLIYTHKAKMHLLDWFLKEIHDYLKIPSK